MTDGAPVKDQPVMGPGPRLPGEGRHQFPLHLERRRAVSQPQSPGDTEDVGVHRDRLGSVHVGQQDVGGLPAHAGERHQLVPVVGHPTSVDLDQAPARSQDVLRLVAVQTARADVRLQLFLGQLEDRVGVAVLAEQLGGDLVDPRVGALRGEDRRDQELVG